MLDEGSIFSKRFHIIKLAGQGGTASVYQSFDSETQGVVALKIISSENQDPNVVNEFWKRESVALESLEHPNIVKFITAGRDDKTGLRFIAMEWLQGKTLEKLFSDIGEITWDEFLNKYGNAVLDALSYAFESNIKHRDLSIRNVYITESGQIKIIDFGQAKIDDKLIGVTVAGWKTAPYGPPEYDTGRYTDTRDPYSFSAIAVRAISGIDIKDHDELYQVLNDITFPEEISSVIQQALSRNPDDRPSNIIDFFNKLKLKSEIELSDDQILIPLRCSPKIHEDFCQIESLNHSTYFDELIEELNDFVSVYPVKDDSNLLATRVNIETNNHRIIVDLDSSSNDHLVIINFIEKRYKLDGLYSNDRWIPNLKFTKNLPRTPRDKETAKNNIKQFYEGFEGYLQDINSKTYLSNNDLFEEWNRLLDALMQIAKTSQGIWKYKNLEVDGLRITVELDDYYKTEEGQTKIIWHNNSRVFVGEIEEVTGKRCTLYCSFPVLRADIIPASGELEADWKQTKIALDRQKIALDKVIKNKLPNKELVNILTLKKDDKIDPVYNKIDKYFDKELDNDKKTIVSRFSAVTDLLLIQGPPGTGKTKLIAELIKQELYVRKDSKILLVSQTHVAIDNALELVIEKNNDLNVIRIGSGTKNISKSVEKCSVEFKGIELKNKVEEKNKEFLRNKSIELGVDYSEVEIGRKAIEVLKLKKEINRLQVKMDVFNSKIDEFQEKLDKENEDLKTNKELTETRGKINSIDEERMACDASLGVLDRQLKFAIEKLKYTSEDGNDLSEMDETELSEWCDVLLDGPNNRKIRSLIEIGEDWRLKFENSQDFKIALITGASVVAGTCIGFGREAAALLTEFDLCVVDEASKATTTELLVPMVQAKKVVLVGDHHQLPAVIDHALKSNHIKKQFKLTDEQLERQLFEALQIDLPDAYKACLTMQYRMRSAIGNLVSHCFYDDQLKTGDDVDKRMVPDYRLAGLTSPVIWFDTDPDCDGTANDKKAIGASCYNVQEVNCIIGLLKRIAFVIQHKSTKKNKYSIAVISSYSAQVNLINSEIKKNQELDDLEIICDTVHAFQGREVDMCVYSITRNNFDHDIGFLKDWRHLNVALSRARDYLMIVGGLGFCRELPEPNPFRELVDYVSDDDFCEIKNWVDNES